MRRFRMNRGLVALAAPCLLLLSGCRPEIPADAWKPTVPLPAQNHVYVERLPGPGEEPTPAQLFTEQDAHLRVIHHQGLIQVAVDGDTTWYGNFRAPKESLAVEKGFYPDTVRYMSGGSGSEMSFTGPFFRCDSYRALTGWFGVDEIALTELGALQRVDLRFELHCENDATILRGRILWTAGSTIRPPGPVNPPPAHLWRAPPGSTPNSGSYAYLASDLDDGIGRGGNHTHPAPGEQLDVQVAGNRVSVRVTGGANWFGEFVGMSSVSTVQPGYYGDLGYIPDYFNPAKGGLRWDNGVWQCGVANGWFVVDQIRWNGTALAALDLRFAQHCGAATPALRGQIHWVAPPA